MSRMKLIAQIKLQPNKEQAQALKQTIMMANTACNTISQIAWDNKIFGQYAIHQLCYQEIRGSFNLSAQMVVRCIAKVADAYKLDKEKQRIFKPLGAIAYDDRILTYYTDKQRVSIWTTNGRQNMAYQCGAHQKHLLQYRQGESDLVFYKGNFYLLAVCNVEEPTPQDIKSVLGIDMGIVNLAVDSMGESFSGETVEQVRKRYHKLRKVLQKRGTKSAKRHLKKLSKKEADFKKNTNHNISKRLVAKAKDTNAAIALEDLYGIGSRTTINKAQRAKHKGWAFYQLQSYILYKALIAGVQIIFVDPRNTSRQCSQCGHVAKANRKSQALFSCVKCNHNENADLNAAKNIANKATVNSPIAVRPKKLPTPATGTASLGINDQVAD